MRAFAAATLLAGLALAACGDDPAPAVTEAPVVEAPEPEAETAALSPAELAGERLAVMVDEYFEENLELNPIFATFIGDPRYNDRFANSISPAHRAQQLALQEKYLAQAQEIDPAELEGQDLLTWEIFVRGRRDAIEGFEYPTHLAPVTQFFSTPNFFAQLGSGTSLHPFATVKDYRDFLGRVDGFVEWMEQAETNMREGMERGIVRPRVLMERVLPQLQAHVVAKAEGSVFWRPVAEMPASFPEEERDSLIADYRDAIENRIVPAYAQLHDFIRDEYLDAATDEVGLTALPGGAAWYDYLVRLQTTTDMSAEEIHQVGLDEVARIRGEMEKVRERVGFEGDLQEFFTHLRADPQHYAETEEELLERYRALKDKVAEAAPRLFSRLPAADFEIRAVEPFRARSAAGASYMSAAPDGSRPGIFFVNTYDLSSRPLFSVESIYLHEAAPGHHFQAALQQELEDLPRFRRFVNFTAYDEGWGLYAESLGTELGLYTDPYQYFGALDAEVLRAIRLVTDTGMHAKGWTREEALQYMLDNSTMGETAATAEIERYIAIPGQALSYKIGQLKIRELRERAAAELGTDFDVREFHTEVLEDGAVPLDVLEAKIERWIEREKR